MICFDEKDEDDAEESRTYRKLRIILTLSPSCKSLVFHSEHPQHVCMLSSMLDSDRS